MAISNLVLTRQIYSEETIGAHAHNRERVPLMQVLDSRLQSLAKLNSDCHYQGTTEEVKL